MGDGIVRNSSRVLISVALLSGTLVGSVALGVAASIDEAGPAGADSVGFAISCPSVPGLGSVDFPTTVKGSIPAFLAPGDSFVVANLEYDVTIPASVTAAINSGYGPGSTISSSWNTTIDPAGATAVGSSTITANFDTTTVPASGSFLMTAAPTSPTFQSSGGNVSVSVNPTISAYNIVINATPAFGLACSGPSSPPVIAYSSGQPAAFSIPSVIPPLQASVTPGSSAGWAVTFSNPSTLDAKNVSATVIASAGGNPVTFDLNSMSTSGSKCALVSSSPVSRVSCTVGTISAGGSVTEYVEVLTTGLIDGTVVSGAVAATSTNAGNQSASLDPVTVVLLTNGVISLAVPGHTLVSSTAALSLAVPAASTTVKPPPVPVTLQAVDPLTLPTLCNGHCLGSAVLAQGDFSVFKDPAHPISALIQIYYGATIPSGTIYMLKPSGAVVALATCVKVGGKYNTPCRKGKETTIGAAGSLATQDIVYFVGDDPTFARR
jgi:hypothetical protein